MTTNIDSHQDRSGRLRRRTTLGSAACDDRAGKRADDAITNLSAYALRLDFEYHRLDDRLLELLRGGPAAAEEVSTVLRERDELEAARQAFRRSVAELHDLTRREAQPALSDQR
ncbi:MAG: hypothetical protein WBQ18_18165 [Solirubrobacteraceae bacterium]|jgi:hypothetical protein